VVPQAEEIGHPDVVRVVDHDDRTVTDHESLRP
jgi:hypothetical protein